ncbi:MAG: hypothetical protein J0H01_17505 [Rhizobiales bacterium]|nr:hypothetical protein [Hyphomicrobiales bacterium]
MIAKADGREMEVVSVRLAGSGKTAIYCAWGPKGSHRAIRRFLADQIEKLPKPQRPPGETGSIGAEPIQGANSGIEGARRDPTDNGQGEA